MYGTHAPPGSVQTPLLNGHEGQKNHLTDVQNICHKTLYREVLQITYYNSICKKLEQINRFTAWT